MNKEDEYPFWIMRAVTTPDNSLSTYFYDKSEDKLFGLFIHKGSYLPEYRNMNLPINPNVEKDFFGLIERIRLSDENIIRLPRLSFEEKKYFLSRFVMSILDEKIKSLLEKDLELFSKNDVFNFGTNLKEIDKNIYFKFDMDKGKFVINKAKEMYAQLGITSNSKILW